MTTADSIFGLRLTHGELEQEPNAFFIRGKWERLAAILMNTTTFRRVHIDYGLYVPEEFVLYKFLETKRGIVLANDVYPNEDINFVDSRDELRRYQRSIDEGKLVVDRPLFLPDKVVEQLKKNGREYNPLKEQLEQSRQRSLETARSLDSYVMESKK